MNDRDRDMQTLRNLIDEAQLVVSTADLPQGRGKRAEKLLASALAMVDDFIAQPPAAMTLGQRGGLKTAERGLVLPQDRGEAQDQIRRSTQ